MNWFEEKSQLMHVLSHVNSACRAGRTNCAMYIEFHRDDLDALALSVPTCLQCIGARDIPVWDDAVEERWEDVVTRCSLNGWHLDQCDNDGYCMKCGYADDPP